MTQTAAPGVRFGPYEILSRLGAGGMGEVWRARDTRLGRDVAIKICAERFTDRFEREAQAIAALNHSNICTLFDVGPEYLVMELVEGETLADRVRLGPIPLEEALDIARQIADALEAAHERGIVHRDLKPGNIKIRPDGSVKVLDFGLAKTAGTHAEVTDDSPTEQALTRAGVILGTAAYMAPEQARGKPVDKRADIWSFGVVLSEMVTGQRAFKGVDATDTLAAIVRGEPDLTGVPGRVRRLVASCLEKDPRKRLRDIGDAWRLLDDPAPATVTRGRVRPWLTWAALAAAGLVLVALAAASGAYFSRRPPDEVVTRFTIPPPGNRVDPFGWVALSPDGRRVVFGASDNVDGLWMRALDAVTATPLPGTEGASGSFWSPDSRSLGLFAGSHLLRLDLAGGAATELANAEDSRGGAWGPDGVIVFAPSQTGPLLRVAAAGGPVAPVTTLDTEAGEIAHRYPSFLPDGKRFVYAAAKAGAERVVIKVGSLESPAERRVLLDAGSAAVFDGGYLTYVESGVLMARPFDPVRLAFTGEAAALADSVRMVFGNNLSGHRLFSAARGVLAYVSRDLGQFTWRDRTGKPVGTLGDPGLLGRPELSPDGKRAAVVISQNGNRDIFTYDLQRGLPNRFTFDPANEDDGMWSPDGKWIVFDSNRKGAFDLYRKATDGSGREELLYADALAKYPMSFSPDGKYLLYWASGDPKTGADIWILPDPLAPSPSRPYPFLRTESRELFPQFSPDGKWVAFYSNETGRQEIYISPFPGPGEKKRVSASGGVVPRWRRDGRELFYIALDGTLMSAEIMVRKGMLEVGTVTSLFGALPTASGFPYDVSADGQQFLTVIPPPGVSTTRLTVVRNWMAEEMTKR